MAPATRDYKKLFKNNRFKGIWECIMNKKLLTEMLDIMLRTRMFEEKVIELEQKYQQE